MTPVTHSLAIPLTLFAVALLWPMRLMRWLPIVALAVWQVAELAQ